MGKFLVSMILGLSAVNAFAELTVTCHVRRMDKKINETGCGDVTVSEKNPSQRGVGPCTDLGLRLFYYKKYDEYEITMDNVSFDKDGKVAQFKGLSWVVFTHAPPAEFQFGGNQTEDGQYSTSCTTKMQ